MSRTDLDMMSRVHGEALLVSHIRCGKNRAERVREREGGKEGERVCVREKGEKRKGEREREKQSER